LANMWSQYSGPVKHLDAAETFARKSAPPLTPPCKDF
jgi:hypothetical protein